MSFLKSIKLVFRRKKNKNGTKIGRNDFNDWLENLIIEKQIKYYEYSDFKNFTFIRENVVRANLKDDSFALRFFNNDDATLHEIVREIKLHEKIVHENILQFYGITKKETDTIYQINKYILVMEHANSGTLGSYLNEHFKKLSWTDKFQLAIQLASAVLCLHENDICHNNMHADNILMHQKSIKLADFGLSNEPGSIQTKKIFNMLPYIDPKSFDIDYPYKLGKKSDVYSVGMLLWQISSGHSPFRTQEYNAELVYAILGGQRETIVKSTPIEYSELYNECWKLEPDERPDMQRIVSILRTLINKFELPKISVIEDNEEIKNDTTTQLVKKFLKDNNVNIIPFDELENPVPLCEGGFGDIKKAIWRNKYVVYKRLINTTIQYNTLNAFIHELKIHLLLQSSYNDRIIHCFGVSQVDKTKEYLLVTQYADGGDLRHYLKKNFKKLTWDDKKKLAYQIADGLNYLHNENVLHRDLHSKNIVIHENNAKIIDFGISKIQDQKSEAYMRDRGIIAYMEPKRILDPNFPYTKSSDIYSFGVLMWEISSGNPPFKNNSFNRSDKDALVYAINNGVREKLIPGTPKEYEELYKNCWDQDPNQRPTTSKILYKFTGMGFGVINAINIELKSDEEKSNKSNSDLQAEKGEGTEKNLEKAFYWYQKAAENGDKEAQFNLGVCYEEGIGIEKDEVEASYWYQEAAQQGFSNAQYKLGFLYKIGKGVEKDLEKSIYWFKKAEESTLNATEWIENALKYEKVKFISYEELKNAEPLHAGGFGQITKATWTKINNYVICKKLTNINYIKNDLLDAFIHELKMHQHLNYSDRIIHLLGISLDRKTNEYFIITQYANGGDLQSYLKENFKNLTWNDKKKLAFQIADGLNCLHNENVLHRDLHSKNIVIHENNAKITFGISKNQNNQTSTAYIGNFGVIAYMEPKRLIDPKFPYTKSSDIYSFGVLMWEISSRHPPFKNSGYNRSDKDALIYAINNGLREKPIPGTPKEYQELYKKCWDQEPNQRPIMSKILEEFAKMGVGVNSGKKNKFIEDDDDYDDDDDDDDDDTELLLLILFNKYYLNHADDDDYDDDDDDDDDDTELLFLNNDNFNNSEAKDSIFWSDALETRLCELYIKDDVVDIFWGQPIEEYFAGSTTWHVYVITRGLYSSTKTETIADNQVIYFIAEEERFASADDPLPNSIEIPQDLKEKFNEALDNELGLAFREKHYNLVGVSTGYKRINGQLTEIPAIILYVRQKGILRRGCGGIFPEKICGFPVDVVEACTAIPCIGLGIDTCRRYQEDVKLGSSIGVGLEKENTTGTLSAVAYENESPNKIGIISCEHVLKFNELDTQNNVVYQPSYEDLFEPKRKLNELLGLSQASGARKSEYIDEIEEMERKLKIAEKRNSTLAIYVRGMRKNFLSSVDNKNYGVDAGFCIFSNKNRMLCSKEFPIFSNYFTNNGLPTCLEGVYTRKDFKNFDYNTKVFKVGRTTGLTIGRLLPTEQAIACSLINESIKIAKKLEMEKHIPNYSNEDQRIFIGYMKSRLDSEIRQNRKKCYPIKWFDRQLAFKFESGEFESGDSGASIIDERGKALGILHAKWITPYQTYGIASPYFAVLEALNVSIYLSPESTAASSCEEIKQLKTHS